MKTIIYAHPWDGSFNHSVLTTLISSLENKQEAYHLIDLYQDDFNPVFSKEELKLFSQGKSLAPLVSNYQQMIKESNEIIFVFPIWWYGLPAILKGFIDKVMLHGFAYDEDEKGHLKGLLIFIEKTTVITTSTIHTGYIETAFVSTFVDGILNEIGLKNENTSWINFDQVNLTTDEKRKAYLNSLFDKTA